MQRLKSPISLSLKRLLDKPNCLDRTRSPEQFGGLFYAQVTFAAASLLFIVTLNLFQGLSCSQFLHIAGLRHSASRLRFRLGSGVASEWTLKQVQGDDEGGVTIKRVTIKRVTRKRATRKRVTVKNVGLANLPLKLRSHIHQIGATDIFGKRAWV